jgi:hypothetical protein
MRWVASLFLVTLSAPFARADVAPRIALSAGGSIGGHDHAGYGGANVGADLEAEVRIGMLTAGVDLGYDTYGVPVHADSQAARIGIAIPLSTSTSGRHIEIDAIGSIEAGVHEYSPNGDRQGFLGPKVTDLGNNASSDFVGVRAGTAISVYSKGDTTGVIWKIELVGRRDTKSVDLTYTESSCGGLFSSPDDCTSSSNTITTGGTELAVTTSIGVVFGQ